MDPGVINVKSFDCGKDAINTYLRLYAAKNMALNPNRTFVLAYKLLFGVGLFWRQVTTGLWLARSTPDHGTARNSRQ